jgi:hypothetical protein
MDSDDCYPQTSIGWSDQIGDVQYDHSVTFSDEVDQKFLFADVLPRIVCHAVINRIPLRGLPELCESLGQMYLFYKDLPEKVLSEPPAVIRGRVERTLERAPFSYVEE